MVKEFKSKKKSKKLKTLKNITLSSARKFQKKLKSLKFSSKNNFKKKSNDNTNQNDESIKIFLDAQSTIKLNCYACNKSIINQIKVILDPNYSNLKQNIIPKKKLII